MFKIETNNILGVLGIVSNGKKDGRSAPPVTL